MSALSYYLEREGLSTTGISLVRENTVSLQPPRALWVSFPLGRPMGMPGNSNFQSQVMSAALDLINRAEGPVLEDYPIDLPPSDIEADIAACPISFQRTYTQKPIWTERLNEELALLGPWHDMARQRRKGHSLSGVNSANQASLLEKLGDMLDKKTVESAELAWLKRAVEDLRFFYLEAMTAQPGDLSHEALDVIFWRESVLGEALIQFHGILIEQGHVEMARAIAPRQALEISTKKKRTTT